MKAVFTTILVLFLLLGINPVFCADTTLLTSTKRIVLVVGNDEYPQIPLNNSVNDSNLMRDRFISLGYTVVHATNTTKRALEDALAEFERLLGSTPNSIGIFYYSGHGLQLDSQNFILPIDSAIRRRVDVENQAIPVANILESMTRGKAAIKILILDACRDNPYRNISSGRGLAELKAPIGTFIAFSTAPGEVSYEGDAADTYGEYAKSLDRELRDKSEDAIEEIFKRVRSTVTAQHADQVPWENTSLVSSYSFSYNGTSMSGRTLEDEKAAFAEANQAGTGVGYLKFLHEFPESVLAETVYAKAVEQFGKPDILVQTRDTGRTRAKRFVPILLENGDTYTSRVNFTMDGMHVEFERESTVSDAGSGRFLITNEIIQQLRIDGRVVRFPPGTSTSPSIPTIALKNGTTVGAQIGENFLYQSSPSSIVPVGQLEVGKEWDETMELPIIDITSQHRTIGKIVDQQRVDVVGGSFNTFVVKDQTEITIQTSAGSVSGSTTVCQYWYTPALPVPVKADCESSYPYAVENLPGRTTSELVRYVKGNRSTAAP